MTLAACSAIRMSGRCCSWRPVVLLLALLDWGSGRFLSRGDRLHDAADVRDHRAWWRSGSA